MQNLKHDIVLCRIYSPWRSNEIVAQYLLVPKSYEGFDDEEAIAYEAEYGESTILRTPLERMTLSASCHGYLLTQLGATENIAVYCDADYIVYDELRQYISDGRIKSGGNSFAPNIETILSVQSDALWISPFENSTPANIETLPLPIIYCADYMENTPLGRAEWMRFYGRMVGKGYEADSLFAYVEQNYEAIARHSNDSISSDSISSEIKPQLLTDLPMGATWYIPGGCSTMGIMYQDAGYDYPWANDNHSGSLALSPEMVLAKANDADIWLFKYYDETDWSYDDFLVQSPYYGQFKAAKDTNIWACNTAKCDYYDIAPFRPDSILKELEDLGIGYFQRLK